MSEGLLPYAVLEVDPKASQAAIDAAYVRLKALLADDQLAAYGMLSPEQLAAQRDELEAAYALLGDATKRAAYDAGVEQALRPREAEAWRGPDAGWRGGQLHAGGRAMAQAALKPQPWHGTQAELRLSGTAGPACPAPSSEGTAGRWHERPEPAASEPGAGSSRDTLAMGSSLLRELPDEAQFNGPLLRRLRESVGASLEDICEGTKISRRYVKAIEADDYGLLPAAVYVRGFVKAYAQVLGLEGKRVADSYLSAVAASGRRL